jgi:hypothetical protein
MADNVIRVNVTTVAPKSLTIQGSKEQNYINATGDTSGYNAQLAKNWAIGEGKIQGIDYSSKHYAGVAKENAELSSESLSNVQELVNGFGETAGNATNELIQVKNDAVVEISNLNTSVIEGIETASNEAIAGIEGARVSAVADVATNKNTAINEIKTIGNTALSSIETKGQEQIKNIEKTGFFMENDKLFFINSKGEVTEECHYYNHQYTSGYKALFFDYSNPLDVAIIVMWHMQPYFWERDNNEKMRNKYRMLWGEDLYNSVIYLHSADKSAH